MHLGQRLRFDLLSADGNHLVDGAVADDFPHDGFGNVAEGPSRFADIKKKFDGIRDAVLNHPLNQNGVQVSRHHARFLLSLGRSLIGIIGARGREPEFLLQLPFDGKDCRLVNTQWQLEMQSRRNVLEILTETLHDSDGIARYRVIGRPCTEADQSKDSNDDYPTRATTRHDPS